MADRKWKPDIYFVYLCVTCKSLHCAHLANVNPLMDLNRVALLVVLKYVPVNQIRIFTKNSSSRRKV